MPTSQLEKEQRETLKARIRAAKNDHAPKRDTKDPPAIKLARRLVSRWDHSEYRRRDRISNRLARRACKLEEELLFTAPHKMLAKIARFEKTGK